MIECIKDGFKRMLKNWKTSSVGAAAFILVTGYLLKYFTAEEVRVVIVTLTGLGFLAAKDGNQTGK